GASDGERVERANDTVPATIQERRDLRRGRAGVRGAQRLGERGAWDGSVMTGASFDEQLRKTGRGARHVAGENEREVGARRTKPGLHAGERTAIGAQVGAGAGTLRRARAAHE